MMLTEAHKKRNEFMTDRAMKVFGLHPRSVAEAMQQYDRIMRVSSRSGARRTRTEQEPPRGTSER